MSEQAEMRLNAPTINALTMKLLRFAHSFLTMDDLVIYRKHNTVMDAISVVVKGSFLRSDLKIDDAHMMGRCSTENIRSLVADKFGFDLDCIDVYRVGSRFIVKIICAEVNDASVDDEAVVDCMLNDVVTDLTKSYLFATINYPAKNGRRVLMKSGY